MPNLVRVGTFQGQHFGYPGQGAGFALDILSALNISQWPSGIRLPALVACFWRALPSIGCPVGRSAGFCDKVSGLEGVRSRLRLTLALDASREIRVAFQASGLPHRRAPSTVDQGGDNGHRCTGCGTALG